MQLHKSKLQAVPPPLVPEDTFLNLSFRFGKDASSSHMAVEADTGYLHQLAHYFAPYRTQVIEHLEGHPGFFSLTIPAPGSTGIRARMHFSVKFIEMKELDQPQAIRHRKDFDRLMDIAQQVAREMVDASLLAPQRLGIDIVAEPLSPTGKLKLRAIDWVSFAVGSTWLTDQHDRALFTDYRHWDPRRADWVTGR